MRACQSAVRGFATIRLMMIHCSISSGSCGYQYPHHHTLPEHTGIKIVSAIPDPRDSLDLSIGRFFSFFFFFSSSFFLLSFPPSNDPSRTNQPPSLPPSLPPHFYSPRQIYPPNSCNLHMRAYFRNISSERTVKLFSLSLSRILILSARQNSPEIFAHPSVPRGFGVAIFLGMVVAGTSEFFVGEKRVTERGRSMRQDLCD